MNKKVVSRKSLAVSPLVTNAQRPTPNTPRSGILLLVVLSMLTLFLLIGTAFIVSANQYRKANKILAKVAEASNSSVDQVNLLEEVLNQIVRDTNNQNSSLRFHSLLRDMYGNDGLLAEIDVSGWAGGNVTITGGQMIEFRLDIATLTDQFGILYSSNVPTPKQLSPISNAYNGLVLTFLEGPVRGQSTRIVGYIPAVRDNVGNITTPALFRVMAPRKADGSNLVAADFTKLIAKRILINGRPFNGTGVGYDPTNTATGTAKLSTTELVAGLLNPALALVPNAAFFDYEQVNTNGPGTFAAYFGKTNAQWTALTPQEQQRLINSMGLTGLGGSDESYDAVDFQNMVLALMPTNPTELLPVTIGSGILQDTGGMLPIPSFHRPALINYWRDQNALFHTPSADRFFEPNMLRKVMLRPSWIDHPNFTGSNPEFANLLATFQNDITDEPAQNNLLNSTIYGPWDVDNDNDGIRDSVWVGFGAPVMENADGRLVKPMAAIMVLDMGGRLNLNAHGSEDIAKPNFNPTFSMAIAGSGNTTNLLPQGQGYGTAEISLDPLMPGTNKAQRWRWYRRLFEGAYANNDFFPNDTASITPRKFKRRRVGKMGGQDNVAGRPGFDMAAQVKMQGMPRWANGKVLDSSGTPVLGGYATAPDLYGRYAVGLNDFGQPVSEAIRDYDLNNKIIDQDSPYEVDLSLGASRGESSFAADTPYSMAEIERVLRAYDPDAGALPSRIWEMAGEFKPNSAATTPNLDTLNLWRTTLTTDSYDLPVPSVIVPGWMVETGPDAATTTGDEYAVVMNKPAVGASFADLLEYRIRAAQNPVWLRTDDVANPTRLPLIQQEIKKLLPPDLADGLRLDINRAVGNGRDDNGNGMDDDGDDLTDEPGEIETDAGGFFIGVVGVVDEPGENEAPFWASSDSQLNGFTGTNGQFRDDVLFLRDLPKDYNGDNTEDQQDLTDFRLARGIDGTIDTLQERVIAHNLRRQMLARDMYVLAMTLVDPFPALPATPTQAQKRERKRISDVRAERLAQWAINIVDFRDPDNIMTAFEYDANPFDGWNADGNMASPNNDIAGPDARVGTRDDIGGVVWGAEGVELVMTETMAWHDRRTTDEGSSIESSNITGPGQQLVEAAGEVFSPDEPDRDFDQKFRPRGACFVELYCPLAANPAVNADTHAISPAGKDLGINIAAVDKLTNTSPVWRMAVYQRPKALKAIECVDWDPDAQKEKQRPNTDEYGHGTEIKADRCVYFAQFDKNDATRLQQLKSMDTSDGVEFFTTLNVPPVRPGRFMVVGSGEHQDGNGRKVLNSAIYASNIGDMNRTSGPGGSKQRRIELHPNDSTNPIQFVESSNAGPQLGDERTYQVDGEPICNVAVITNALSALGPTALSRRFTISEPAKGYPGDDPINFPPTGPSYLENIPGNPGLEGRYGNAAQAAAYDRPHDDVRADGEDRLQLMGNFDPNDPLMVECFSMIYLQRLANPLLPFHKETNPYRTVDGMSANVSLFNGLIGNPARPSGESFQTDIQSGSPAGRVHYENRRAELYLASLQRGYTQSTNLLGAQYKANVLGYEPPNVGLSPGEAVRGFHAPRKNQFRPTGTPVKHAINAIPDMTLGRINQAFMSVADQNAIKNRNIAAATTDGLTPEDPFPWLTWNNRPFANSNELLLVPRSRSSQLLREFSGQVNTGNPFLKKDVPKRPSRPGVPAATRNGPAYLGQQALGLFGHLPNMFLSEPPAISKIPDAPAGLFRVLDYLHVPSPFVKTETWLNPTSFGNSNVTSIDDPRYLRQPPFNRIAQYREPGRVNLNTVVSADVWDGGILHREKHSPGAPWNISANNYDPRTGHSGPIFLNNTDGGLVSSRRGYGNAGDSILKLNNDTPTFFENPFRSSDAFDLVPVLAMPQDNATTPANRKGVNVTMLRQDDFPTAANMPPLFAGTSTNGYDHDADRNAYFKMQPMTRLSSMTTNRSNVYAVWVTIGFFEVEEAPDWNDPVVAIKTAIRSRFGGNNDDNDPVTIAARALYDRVYPEGYQFGKEAGSDTGDIRRVREFAMIDRTVPVAFEPGKNHNVDKAIRLRRRIE